MITIRDVAERAEVSIGTVSRVLNGHASVRPVTRRAVQAAIRELGYRPNVVARSLRSSSTQVLGVLLQDLAQPMAIRAIRGAEAAAHDHGYGVLVADSQADAGREGEQLQRLLERRVDGLICFPVRGRAPIADALASVPAQVVFIGQTRAHRTLPTAVVDEAHAAEEAVRDLASLGHRRVAVIASASQMSDARGRMLQSTLRRLGLDAGASCTVAQWPDAVEATRRLLAEPDPPTALIAGTQGIAPFVIRGIRAAGRRFPVDVSLITFGESDWALAIDPPLNVIAVDFFTHARDAVELLIRRIAGDESAPRTLNHPSTYTRRGSVGPAPQPTSTR